MKNDSIKLKIILFCFIFISFIYSVKIAEAAGDNINLSVAPQSFEIKAQKGDTIKDKIKIYNRGQSSVALEAIVDDFGAEEESGSIKFDNIFDAQKESVNTEDVSQWIKIENPNFILDPGEQESINFTISVPQNVSDGGKYAVIFFQPRKSSSSGENSVKVLPKVGVIFLLSVGDTAPGKLKNRDLMNVAEFNIPENFHLKKLESIVLGATGLFNRAIAEENSSFSIVETSEVSFSLRLKNNDAYHIKPGGYLTIVSSGGKVLGETKITQTTILPGKTRYIPINFKPDRAAWHQKYLPASISDFIFLSGVWGKYEARLFLQTDAGALMEKSVEFWIFPWKTGLVLIFIAAAFILARKRIRLAADVLFNLKLKNQSEK